MPRSTRASWTGAGVLPGIPADLSVGRASSAVYAEVVEGTEAFAPGRPHVLVFKNTCIFETREGSPLQLVEAVILLLVGMLPGVWMTLVDFYAQGASAFSAHVSVWLLLVLLLATNARYRRQAAWCAGWLSFGYIETYYLCSSYSFEGMARSVMAPLALLAVVGGVVASVGWAAKRERGALGLALKALVVVATLVACVATHDGISALDATCTVIIAYLLFIMRSRKVALVRHQPEAQVSASQESRSRETARRLASRERRSASSRRVTGDSSALRPEGRRGARRPARNGRQEPVRQRVAAADASRHGQEPRGVSSAFAARSAQGSSRRSTVATETAETPPSRRTQDRALAKPQGQRKTTSQRGSRAAAGRKTPKPRAKSQKPTRRTGGAVPDANRIRSSASGSSRERDLRGSAKARGSSRGR